MAPAKVNQHNQDSVWNVLYVKRLQGKKSKNNLKVGDKVPLNKKFSTCTKSYLPGWTEEVFVVTRVNRGLQSPPTRSLNGTKGTFYKQETYSEGDLFRVE